MARLALLCVALGLLVSSTTALDFVVSTPPDEDPSTPDANSAETIASTAGAIGSQVLPNPGTELVLFGIITPDSAAAALGKDCGGLTAGSPADFKISTDKGGWGDTEGETGTYSIIQTFGCDAASSETGDQTEITFRDPSGRQELILCGDDVEDAGCGWWWLGDDVMRIEDALAAAPEGTDSSVSPSPADASPSPADASPSPADASPSPSDASDASPPPADSAGAPPAASGGRKMLQTTTIMITISISTTMKPEVKPTPAPICKDIPPGRIQRTPGGKLTDPFSGKGCITPNTVPGLCKTKPTPNPTPKPKGQGVELAPGIYVIVVNVPKAVGSSG